MARYRLISFILLLLTLLAAFTFPAGAATSNITYSGNSGDIIFAHGSSYSPTDLFSNFKDVMPGDSLSQTITLYNKADSSVKIKIYLRSLGSTDSSFNDFLSHLQLTVKASDSTPFFDAAANKKSTLTDWTEIGTLYSGEKVDVKLTLTVPTSLDNSYQDEIGKIKWEFTVVEMPADDEWKCDNCNKSKYKIVDYDDYSEYECLYCGYRETMLCEECGGRMHRVIYKQSDGKIWYYYICENNENHHTVPAPQTGDNSHIVLYISIFAITAFILFILIFLKRRKDKENPDGVK